MDIPTELLFPPGHSFAPERTFARRAATDARFAARYAAAGKCELARAGIAEAKDNLAESTESPQKTRDARRLVALARAYVDAVCPRVEL